MGQLLVQLTLLFQGPGLHARVQKPNSKFRESEG